MREQLSWKRFRLGSCEPEAMREPEGAWRDTPEVLKRTLHGRESMRHTTDKRRTVVVRIKRALSRVMLLPRPTLSLMEPIPMAVMEDPLMPLTERLEMGHNEVKSLRSGEM